MPILYLKTMQNKCFLNKIDYDDLLLEIYCYTVILSYMIKLTLINQSHSKNCQVSEECKHETV